ncbi:hypothetical protein WA158_007478 [Blastocystis sp. Blastoise]
MIELFGDQGREAVKEAIKKRWFKQSAVIKRKLEEFLVNCLGKEKKWKLLFRASKYNYFANKFHKYCDNKEETVTLIKHIGDDNHMNIFGGYIVQSWDGSDNTYIY